MDEYDAAQGGYTTCLKWQVNKGWSGDLNPKDGLLEKRCTPCQEVRMMAGEAEKGTNTSEEEALYLKM